MIPTWSRATAGALLTVLLLTAAGAAQAAWYKAETDRFVVYGEGREATVREYAEKLTAFDATLRKFHPSTLDRVPATKVQLYLVDGLAGLRRIRPELQRNTGGFYTAMNEGVFATAVTDERMGADDVLFHEYAHHFMLENFPVAYPAWFVEGFAEYFMTAEVTKAGVKVGAYNPARAYAVFLETWLPWEELFSKTSWQIRRERRSAYYAQSWLLVHFMRSTPERAVQLDKAITAISEGQDPVKAFQAATGLTMEQLTAELRKYRKLKLYMAPGLAAPPAITVTRLGPSADDLLLDNLRLILASTGRVDADFLATVRRRAARHPGDAFAEMTLARAEYVMGDVATGDAIMKRRVEAAPDDLETLVLSGTGHILAGMRDGAVRQERFRKARPLLAKAYAADRRDFRPLYGYALARSVEPEFPTDNDLNALLEARELAPSVQENSLRAGLALLRKGRRDDAAKVLAVVVNNPHAGRAAAQAKALIDGRSPSQAEAAAAAAEDDPVEPETPPEREKKAD